MNASLKVRFGSFWFMGIVHQYSAFRTSSIETSSRLSVTRDAVASRIAGATSSARRARAHGFDWFRFGCSALTAICVGALSAAAASQSAIGPDLRLFFTVPYRSPVPETVQSYYFGPDDWFFFNDTASTGGRLFQVVDLSPVPTAQRAAVTLFLSTDYVLSDQVVLPNGARSAPDTQQVKVKSFRMGDTQYGWTVVRGLEVPRAGAFGSVAAGGYTDQFRIGPVLRRTTVDGSEYEAAPVAVTRDGKPLTTLYFVYRLGQLAWTSSEALPAAQRDVFELAALPAPLVEGEVIEYINTKVSPASNWGHYFYAASDGDKSLLDTQTDWARTGRAFKSGGYLPVCRFLYRPPNGGPASHFYTVKADECEQFKRAAGFTFEGVPFRASLPRPLRAGQAADDPARCPEKSRPLWRVFNQPAASGANYAPNHRYVRNKPVAEAMAGEGYGARWALEGIAMCVPE